MAVTSAAPESGAFELTRPPRSLWGDAIRRLTRNKMAVASVILILLIMLVAVLAPVLAPFPPSDYMSRPGDPGGGGTTLPPAWQAGGNSKFLLGTDASGRDVLSRVMWGAQVSLAVGFIPVAIIVTIGMIVGMAAGYLGGRVDNFLMRVTDVVYAFPAPAPCYSPMRGSSASRRPSPKKVKASVSTAMQVAGTQTRCGAALMFV